MNVTEKNGLKINTKLLDFVNNEIIPGTNIRSEEFWTNFGKIVHELAPINKELIQKRDDIQKKIEIKLQFKLSSEARRTFLSKSLPMT